MWRYYELLSSVPVEELETMRADAVSGTLNPRDAKIRLARELVTQYHDADAAENAATEFANVFKKKLLPDEIPEAPSWGSEPKPVSNVLSDFKLTDSASAARRRIQQGAVTINGDKVSDVNLSLEGGKEYLIKVGKKRFLKILPS